MSSVKRSVILRRAQQVEVYAGVENKAVAPQRGSLRTTADLTTLTVDHD